MSENPDSMDDPPLSGGGMPSPKSGEPWFCWNFDHKLDTQKRVQFPANWRPENPDTRFVLVLWPHPHMKPVREFGFIMGFTMRQFGEMLEKLEAKGPGNRQAAALKRKIFHNAFELGVDPAGRLCLPPKMATQVDLDKEAHFVGAGGHFEIWDPESFKACSQAEDAIADEGYESLG